MLVFKLSRKKQLQNIIQIYKRKVYFGWKSWLGVGAGAGLELLIMMREARNRKSSNSCWISDGPVGRRRRCHRISLQVVDMQTVQVRDVLGVRWRGLTELFLLLAAE